jgi:hypothetical protein
VANSNTQAENLLQLELDSGAHVSNLVLDRVVVSDGSRELVHLVQLGTQDTRNLLDDGISGEESVVLVGWIEKSSLINWTRRKNKMLRRLLIL